VTPGGALRVGVAGAGTMGGGIAELAARSGLTTTLYDVDDRALSTALDRFERSSRRALKDSHTRRRDADAARTRLTTTTELKALADCDVIVEAAPEAVDLKGELLAALAVAAPGAVLASNTSSLSISDLADRAGSPEQVVGLHFFNPPALMRLVELVSTDRTHVIARERARSLAEALGKEVVLVSDGPGFLLNRCARPYYLEALRIVEGGLATHTEIDRVCVEDGGFPMGPFELMDLIGIDVSLAVTRSMWERSSGEPRWRPSPLQVAMVGTGRLGRKSRGGFYADGDRWANYPPPKPGSRVAILERIVAQLVNEAAFVVEDGVASLEDVDRAIVVGLNHPRGPGTWAHRLGRDRIVAILDELWERDHDMCYRVSPHLRGGREWATDRD
jgi:3-hydroxybutyryl-CoA dehydrogenase